MRVMDIRMLLGAGVTLAAAGAIGVGLATAGDSSGAPAGTVSGDGSALKLALLNDAKGESATGLLPSSTAAGFDTATARVALMADGVRIVAVRRSDPRIAIGGGELVCVFAVPDRVEAAPAGGSCTAVERFNRRGVVAFLPRERGETVIGLVPDGVDGVEVASARGRTSVPTVDNGFAFATSGSVRQVSFDGPAGRVAIDGGR